MAPTFQEYFYFKLLVLLLYFGIFRLQYIFTEFLCYTLYTLPPLHYILNYTQQTRYYSSALCENRSYFSRPTASTESQNMFPTLVFVGDAFVAVASKPAGYYSMKAQRK